MPVSTTSLGLIFKSPNSLIATHTSTSKLTKNIALSLFIAFAINACSSDSNDNAMVVVTPDGNTSSVANAALIPVGDTLCPNGGVTVDSGIDENANGVLDTSEIDNSQSICNGAVGTSGVDGLSALLSINSEPVGNNCASGGSKIESGIDSNRDGVLNPSEINLSQYVCNGERASNALITLSAEPQSINCTYGGIRVDSGLDLDNSGQLDVTEITNSKYVCNGFTRKYGWNATQKISLSAGESIRPLSSSDLAPIQLIINEIGHGFSAWMQLDPVSSTAQELWVNRFDSSTGWETAVKISSEVGTLTDWHIAQNNNGDAVLIWRRDDGARFNLWASIYQQSSGWSTPLQIDSNDNTVISAHTTISDSGLVIVAWSQADNSGNRVWYRQYGIGAGWQVISPVTTTSYPTPADALKLTSDPFNSLDISFMIRDTAVLPQISTTALYTATKMQNDTTWSEPATLPDKFTPTDEIDPAFPYLYRIADNGYRIFGNYHYSYPDRQSPRIDIPGAPINLNESPSIPFVSFVSPDFAGYTLEKSILVFSPIPQRGLRSIHRDVNGWTNYAVAFAKQFGILENGTDADPRIDTDVWGNAIAVWTHVNSDPNTNFENVIWSNRYRYGIGWGKPELAQDLSQLIGTKYSGSGIQAGEKPVIAMNRRGDNLIVWYTHTKNIQEIWASSYSRLSQ